MAILVAANFDADESALWWRELRAAFPEDRLVADRADAHGEAIDIVLAANPPAGSLRDLPALRLIQSMWAGVDRLLADPTLPVDVLLARMVDPAMNEAMAQTALWAVLGVQRDFLDCLQQQRDGVWRQPPYRAAGELTVLVLGLGEMGRAVVRRLAQHGCRVLGWSRSAAALEGIECHAGFETLPAALARAHVAINLLPLTPQTRGLFDAERLALLPRGATLLNFGRGAHVVDADLLDALDRGHLRRAVLDVFAAEPLPAGHRYWTHRAVTMLPHIAAPTDPRSAAPAAARNVAAFRAGRPLFGLVDRARGY